MSRTNYLSFRCHRCGRLITALELEAMWEKAERTGELLVGVCTCGSKEISPGNVKWWEELLYPKVWKLFFKRVLLPRLRGEKVTNGPAD